MILLLGATSYIGQAFARRLQGRKDSFIPLSRKVFDYSRYEFLFDYIRKVKPDLVINAADCPETPNSPPGKLDRVTMLQTNSVLPQTISRVCQLTKTTFGHVSTGAIYSGAKVADKDGIQVIEDLGASVVRELFAADPQKFLGFSESDTPNFSFNSPPCTFYSGTKALAEEALKTAPAYVWRFQLPFDQQDDSQNLLSQISEGLSLHDSINSVSHLDDCVEACLELWERNAPFGTYNVVNPGPVRTHEVVQMMAACGKSRTPLRVLIYDEAAPASERIAHLGCILDGSKLLRAGIKLRTARSALQHTLQAWAPQTSSSAVGVPS